MFMSKIKDMLIHSTNILNNSNDTYCRIVSDLEWNIKQEIKEYVGDDDVVVFIGTHLLSIRLPDYIEWDASDLLTVELRYDCKFVKTIQLSDARQYEFKWM
jgi:hypothetical protein